MSYKQDDAMETDTYGQDYRAAALARTPPSFYDSMSPELKKRGRFHSPMVQNAYMASPKLPQRHLQQVSQFSGLCCVALAIRA
jgi:hypothetical protein